MGALLQVENLSVALPTRSGYHKAVDGISFAVDAGEVMGIAGESGSGKTITALSLFGLLPPGRGPAARSGWTAPSCSS